MFELKPNKILKMGGKDEYIKAIDAHVKTKIAKNENDKRDWEEYLVKKSHIIESLFSTIKEHINLGLFNTKYQVPNIHKEIKHEIATTLNLWGYTYSIEQSPATNSMYFLISWESPDAED